MGGARELSEELKWESLCSARCQEDADSSGVKVDLGMCQNRVKSGSGGRLCNTVGSQLLNEEVGVPAPGVLCDSVCVRGCYEEVVASWSEDKAVSGC